MVLPVTFREPPTAATDAYFGSMSEMQNAIGKHDYETAAVRAREMMAVIPAWIEEETARSVWAAEQRERWDIGQQTEPDAGDVPLLPPSIPVFQQGGTDPGARRRRRSPSAHGRPG